MANYIDGFVFPQPKIYINEYINIAEKVAAIWKDHGALNYLEFVGDELRSEGTKSFIETLDVKKDEIVIFGWVTFPSKEVRDLANNNVPNDPRMTDLVAPLINPNKLIFDSRRMVYGGFRSMIQT